MAVKKKTTKEKELKVYLLEFKGGTKKRITIPADYKVTFGPLVPGSKSHNGHDSLCLRIYETKEKQRAVFTNVMSFRDQSIPVSERIVHTKNERATRQTADGAQDFTVQAQYTEWRDEGDEPKSFVNAPKLPHLAEDDQDKADDVECIDIQ